MGFRKSIFFKLAVRFFLLAPLLAPVQASGAEWKPTKTMTMIVTSGAGGAHDILARATGRLWVKYFGVKVIIKNIKGAGGALGIDTVAKAAPDGHTIGFMSTSAYLSESIKQNFPWKISDFPIVVSATTPPYIVVSGAKSKFKSWDDVRKAKRRVSVASSGRIMSDVAYIKDLTDKGVNVVTAVFGKSSKTRLAIASGDADLWSTPMSLFVMTMIAEKTVDPLFIYAEKRHPALPNVPTHIELGMPKEWKSVRSLRIFFGTPKTPKNVVDSIEARMTKLFNDPSIKQWADKEGLVKSLRKGADAAESLTGYYGIIRDNLELYKKHGG